MGEWEERRGEMSDGRCEAAVCSWQGPKVILKDLHGMRVLIGDASTGHYYGTRKKWVIRAQDAYDFEELWRASKVVREGNIPTSEPLEIVLRYENPACELAVPLAEDWQRSPRQVLGSQDTGAAA